MKKLSILVTAVLLFLCACYETSEENEPDTGIEDSGASDSGQQYQAGPLSPENWEDSELEEWTEKQNEWGGPEPQPALESDNAMISGTSSALAVRSGLGALERGGSAADAVITTALAQIALVAGSYVSYAGIFFLTYYDAAEDRVYYLNAGFNSPLHEDDPATIPPMDSGTASGRTALVPGFFAGIEAAHSKFGILEFSDLFGPAVYFAEKGFMLGTHLEYYIDMRKDVLSRLPETKAVFTKKNGEWYRADDWFRQPALAATLKKVALEGADYIYRGAWTQKFVDMVQADDGKMTMEDMELYQVIWSEPLTTTFRDYEIYSPGLPSSGGVNTIEALNVLEAAGYPEQGSYTEDAEALFWFMMTHRLMILSYLNESTLESIEPDIDLSYESRATKETARALWEEMKKGDFYFTIPPEQQKKGSHSDSVVAVDEYGNVAAVTHTINCVVWGETGIFVDGISIPDAANFQQQKMLDYGPGNRIPEETNPSIIFKDDMPVLASSSIGITHYRTVPVLYNYVAYDMDIESAFHETYLLYPDLTNVEGAGIIEHTVQGAFSSDLVDEVRDMGVLLDEIPDSQETEYRGYWIGIEIDPVDSSLTGVTSSYLNGAVAGY